MIEFGDLRLPARFWSKIAIDPETECWNWLGALNSRGYGCIGVGGARTGKRYLTHRYMLMAFREVPANMQVDHLCLNKRCANPRHLEVVTCRVNVQRASAVLYCANGHLMSGDNIRLSRRGRRLCVECCRESNRRYRIRRKERVAAEEIAARLEQQAA
jgi:hypothetical protein